MGWNFSYDDANTVAWITTPDSMKAREQLDEDKADRLLYRIGSGDILAEHAFISQDPKWAYGIKRLGTEYLEKHQQGLPEKRDLLDWLARFRDALIGGIYLVATGFAASYQDFDAVTAFLRNFAYRTGNHGLSLIPDRFYPRSELGLFEPFPAFAKIARVSVRLPAILFWTLGEASRSHLCSLEAANQLFGHLLEVINNPSALDQLLADEAKKEKKRPTFLQISDLHFGAPDVAEKQTLLTDELQTQASKRDIKRVVITGDIVNGPRRANGERFRIFKDNLTMLLKQAPIVIPGNHDQKWCWGIFGRTFREIVDLDWYDVFVDDELGVIFLCFDSSRDANAAKGIVTETQRRRVATALATKLRERPDIKRYLRVALVHHHPFTFPEGNNGVWKLYSKVGFNRESMLRMDDAEAFLSWCALKGATLVLHGHKHVPYQVDSVVQVDPAINRTLTIPMRSVGCGSSTGVGNWPMSINCVAWDPDSKEWSVTFLVDRGDGSEFRDAAILIREENIDVTSSFD
jgi:hypothetical protein